MLILSTLECSCQYGVKNGYITARWVAECGAETISYREIYGTQIRNLILERLRALETLSKFKQEIKKWKCDACHCGKIVQIRSYFWSVFSCIQPEYRKIQTRNNSVFEQFSSSLPMKNVQNVYSPCWLYQLRTVMYFLSHTVTPIPLVFSF